MLIIEPIDITKIRIILLEKYVLQAKIISLRLNLKEIKTSNKIGMKINAELIFMEIDINPARKVIKAYRLVGLNFHER